MIPRRVLAPCLAVLCALVAAASLPWTVSTGSAVARVDRDLRQLGLSLTAAGATDFTLLPWPRLTFRSVALSAESRSLATSATLTVHLALLPLVVGRPVATELAFEGAHVTLGVDAQDDRWGGPLRRLAQQALADAPSLSLTRVSLHGSTLAAFDPRTGRAETAQAVNLAASWPRPSAAIAVSGGFAWRGRPATLHLSGVRPAELLSGARTPFALSLGWPRGGLSLEGTAALMEGPRFAGRASLSTEALGETLDWLGADLALAPFIGPLGIETAFETTDEGVVLPNLRVSAGANVFDGAGGLSEADGRLGITATLATDALDLAPVLISLRRALDGDAGWSREPLALGRFTGCDLDLRLSAGRASLGALRADDLASSLQVKDGAIEATVGRASLQGGVVKGRLALAGAPGGTDVRASGSFDRVDLGALLVDLGAYRWVVGTAQGQLALEGTGASLDEMMRRIGGRASLVMRDGELSGINLADALERAEAGSQTVQAVRLAGRTPFERAELAATFTDGLGTISAATLRAPALRARLGGRISLPERSLSARAEIEAEGGGRGAALFDVSGPWARLKARSAGPMRSTAEADALLDARAIALPAAASAYAQ